MGDKENRRLDFVLRHYKEGIFDTGKAIKSFRDATGSYRSRNRQILRSVSAAVAVAAAVIFGVFIFRGRELPVRLVSDGDIAVYTLPDSTVVTLGPYSEVEYLPGKSRRRPRNVRMSGKVFFSVSRDERQPFEIFTDNAYIKVLGTRFQVIGDPGTDVYVESGKVFFAKDAAGEGLVLTKGMSAELSADATVPASVIPLSPNPAVWATGVFVYDATPLREVLDELSGFYGISLDASDYDRKLSGSFEASAGIEEITDIIENALDVTVFADGTPEKRPISSDNMLRK